MVLEGILAFRVAINLYKVLPPVFLAVGTIGNLITVAVMARGRSRGTSTAVYLCALALSDLTVLFTMLLRNVIQTHFEVDMKDVSGLSCKIHTFVVYLSTQMSSWTLVCVTCERLIGVYFPHKLKNACTRKSAAIILAAIGGTLCLINGHFLFGMGIYPVYGEDKCTPVQGRYDTFVAKEVPWLDLCLVFIFPFAFLLCGNTAILVKLAISRRKTKRKVTTTGTSKTSKKDDRSTQLTIMVVVLNVSFVICMVPYSVYFIILEDWTKKIRTYEQLASLILTQAICQNFNFLNYTINFVLYFLSSRKFREDFKALFFGKCLKTGGIRGGTSITQSKSGN